MRDENPSPQSNGSHPLDARLEELAPLRPAAAAEDAPVPLVEGEPVAAVPVRPVVRDEPCREELDEVCRLLGMPLREVLVQRRVQVFLVVVGRLEGVRRVARVVLAVVHFGRFVLMRVVREARMG